MRFSHCAFTVPCMHSSYSIF
uniref:Uncharacterized protein n=1 Tax=Arundo donax TaxID=35708 RepID=A0A0A9G8R6_ARUDO